MHDLLMSEQRERMKANGRREQTDDSVDREPVVKLILPSLGMVWLLTSFDPRQPGARLRLVRPRLRHA